MTKANPRQTLKVSVIKKIIYDVTVNMQHVYFVKGVRFGGRKGTTV